MRVQQIGPNLALFVKSSSALRYGARHALPGVEFARLGRAIGWNLLSKGQHGAAEYLLTPVSSTRYFEFAFAKTCLPSQMRQCLDVGSPRLFSFYVATHRLASRIRMINPDLADQKLSEGIRSQLRLSQVEVECKDAGALAHDPARYDCIWAISVIEHVRAGTYDDRDVVRWLISLLREHGRLILTVPVDRNVWDEYRDSDPYGTQSAASPSGHFFQRFYDWDAIQERIIDSVGCSPTLTRWYGEKTPGRFLNYIKDWQRDGRAITVGDPREFADHYREYASWNEMPGAGVCGLMFERD